MATNFLDALKTLGTQKKGPQSTLPGYDDLMAGDPSYDAWSAQRPEFQADTGTSYGEKVRANDLQKGNIMTEGVRANQKAMYAGVDRNNLDAMRQARRSDYQTRLDNQGPNPQLERLLGTVTKDINEDPWSGLEAQKRSLATDEANRAAEAAGFGANAQRQLDGYTPVQRQAMTGRAEATYKIDEPIRLEQQKAKDAAANLTHMAEVTRMLNGQGSAAPTHTSQPPPSGKVYLDETTGEPIPSQAPSASSSPSSSPSSDFTPKPSYKLGMGASGPTITERPQRNLLAADNASVNSMRQAHRMSQELMGLLPQEVGPEPTQMPGFFGQLWDVGIAKGKRELYSQGFQDPTLSGDKGKAELYNKITQLAELSKVIATRGLQGGSRNMEWIRQIQDHVAQGRMPTATMRQRLQTMIEEYPKMIQDIYATRANEPLSTGQEQ